MPPRFDLSERICEPERMTEEEERDYARADYSAPHEALAQGLIGRLAPKEAVMLADLGCGPGDVLIRMRPHGPWALWGIDMSPAMLTYAAEDEARRVPGTARPINWLIADIKRTGLPTGAFDGLISNSVPHHMPDPVAFWREIRRLARPGALVQVRDLRRPASGEEADAIVERHVSRETDVVQRHYRSSLASAFTVEEVRRQLDEAGLGTLQVVALEDRYLDVEGQVHGA